MLTIVGGIAILGVLVFVHELGHFCVAKYAGVKVLKFSLGFGPRLVSRQWGETEYMICAVPLGGYVLMLGEGSGEEGETAELSPEDEARTYAKKSVGVRTAIIAAGPLMNLILPFILLPIAYMVGVSVPAYIDQPACPGYVVSDSPAAKAGFQANDCIVAINGDVAPTWDAANNLLISHIGKQLTFKVRRNGIETELTFADGGVDSLNNLGLFPPLDAVLGELPPGMPAAMAGLKEGDRIKSIDDVPIGSWYEIKKNIQSARGKAQRFLVVRKDGTTETLSIVAKNEQGEYLIGIGPFEPRVEKNYGFVDAVSAGWQRGADLIRLTYLFIGKLFTGQVSISNIGGPISVVQMAGQGSLTDVPLSLLKLAFLSIQLGILNLLPIPILDGGHLFFNLLELIIRRPLSLRLREVAQQIGLAMLLLLMVVAFYNDIARLIGG